MTDQDLQGATCTGTLNFTESALNDLDSYSRAGLLDAYVRREYPEAFRISPVRSDGSRLSAEYAVLATPKQIRDNQGEPDHGTDCEGFHVDALAAKLEAWGCKDPGPVVDAVMAKAEHRRHQFGEAALELAKCGVDAAEIPDALVGVTNILLQSEYDLLDEAAVEAAEFLAALRSFAGHPLTEHELRGAKWLVQAAKRIP